MAERLLNVVRGFGSIFDLWPGTRDGEWYPYDADTVLRRSWERTGEAIWQAIEELGHAEEETPPDGLTDDPHEGHGGSTNSNT
ncbi:hypothetical protein [Candidatus Palauibacter sp.]|uniref:hypothetical protein n=1 Tax=Candidatus Palauibacter sp. TaxID=3101350 RepID=UPI003B52A6DF